MAYIAKSTLEWKNLWSDFGMERDKGGRWFPGDDTPEWVVEFLSDKRSPSRAWPLSYAKSMLTQKFAKLVCEKDHDLAIKVGVAK